LADLVPGDDDVLVRPLGRDRRSACRERLADGRQPVERSRVAPPDELAARLRLEDLERADGRLPEGSLRDPERAVALPDRDVLDGLADSRRDVCGQGPRRRRPDEEGLARAVDQREADRQAGVLPILVALGHLVLADAGAAAGTPGHRVMALVDP